jgi:hypothetical protein
MNSLAFLLIGITLLGFLVGNKQCSPIFSIYSEILFIALGLTAWFVVYRLPRVDSENRGHTRHISLTEFEIQKRVHTEYKLNQLIESSQYQEYRRKRDNL